MSVVVCTSTHVVASLLTLALLLNGIGAQQVVVIGRHLIIPDPMNASAYAAAFDFNGVSINALFPTSVAAAPCYRIDVALSTSCFRFPNGSWSNESHQPHRFRTFVQTASGGAWLEPSQAMLVDTSASPCNVVRWSPMFVAHDAAAALVAPFNVSLFKITEPDWNAADANVPNYVLFHALRFSSMPEESDVGSTIATARIDGRSKSNPDSVEQRAVGGSGPWASSPAPSPIQRIQFIGDSITAGYCNTCNLFPNATNNYALEDFGYSWATLTCGAFSATCHTAAWSGRGLIRNCDDNFTVWMPSIVQRTLATVAEDDGLWGVPNRWNFQQFIPDVVVVNLGTNDYACNPIPNATEFNTMFEQAYVHMLRMLLTQYGNRTRGVFLACGPMCNMYCGAVHNVIATLRSLGEGRIFFLNQTNLLQPADTCCGHPDTVGDQRLANVTIDTIRNALGL